MSAPLLFSTIEVSRQAFYRTTLSYAIVNIKPIVPGRKSLCGSLGLNDTLLPNDRRSCDPNTSGAETSRPYGTRADFHHDICPDSGQGDREGVWW